MRNKILKKLLAMAVTIALTLPAGLHASVQTRINDGAVVPTNINNTYGKAAFAPATGTTPPAMYLGAKTFIAGAGATPADKAAALARVTLSAETGKVVGKVESLAPIAGTLNGVAKDGTAGNEMPLYGKKVVNLKLNGDLPVVTIDGEQNVYALTKNDGTEMLKNVGGANPYEKIFDAGGALTEAIVGLAVGTANDKETAFAAVTQTGKTWQIATGVDRGIAVLQPDDVRLPTKLEVLNAADFGEDATNAKAAKLKAETIDTLTTDDIAALTALNDALTAAGAIDGITSVELATVVAGVKAAVDAANTVAAGAHHASGAAARAAVTGAANANKAAGVGALDAKIKGAAAVDVAARAAIDAALAAVDADIVAVGPDGTAATKQPVIDVVAALNADFVALKANVDTAAAIATLDVPQMVAQAIEYTNQVNTARNHLSFAPRKEFALDKATTTAELGPDVDLYWSNNLGRLYIGLKNVHRDDPTLEGGCMGLVMGRVDPRLGTPVGGKPSGALVLQPVVAGLKKELFYEDPASVNQTDRIVGFYFDGSPPPSLGQQAMNVSVKQVRDMLTSTGKNYLIVNSNITSHGIKGYQHVYALPVAPAEYPAGTKTAPEKVGTLMKVDADGLADWNFGVPPGDPQYPDALDNMPSAKKPSITVGSSSPDKISDIFVNGDTVYMAMNGNTAATAGLFASTALFNENGVIREWTPPVRVTGDVNSVLAAGVDSIGNFYAATGESNDPTKGANFTNINTVKVTQWGKSDDVTTNNNLSSLLATEFPESTGGIVAMHSFDQRTPGFMRDRFAMLVVVGPTKIALIQTGYVVGVGGFVPTQVFSKTAGVGQNVFVFDATTPEGAALAAIAPLTCAEVSRMTAADSGWLFVGGYGGVAVLRTAGGAADAGNGFASQGPGLGVLTAAGYPGAAAWTFKQLTPNVNADAFKNVVKMVAWNGRMYVVTLAGVFSFGMVANKFTDGAPAALADEKVGGAADNPLDGAVVADLVVLSPNAVVADNRGIIATDRGIYASDLSAVAANTVPIPAAQFGDLALQLQLLGADKHAGSAPSSGNVMVLGVDFDNNNDVLYRLDVSKAAVAAGAPPAADFAKPVKLKTTDTTGKVVAFNSTKQGFNTDGTGVVATLPKHYEHLDYVTLDKVGVSGSQDITSLLNIDTGKEKWVSGAVREGAFGAIMVPGDFGVRVNE